MIALLCLFLTFSSCNNDEILFEVHEVENELDSNDGQKDLAFNFDPKRWGIVEGIVSDEVAINNKEILNSMFAQAKELGISIFEIGAMDAYFKVDVNKIGRVENHEGSLRIPSDFHLKMSDDTFLRVQPNKAATYTLMTTYLTDNTKITGGNLVGDRYEHDYSPFTDAAGVKRDEHGWGHLLWIIGSHNIEVDNLNLSNATGDAVVFHSKNLRNNDGSLQADNREVNNVVIKNTTITECRRNGISILDGRNITFDNCIIKDTGNGAQLYDVDGAKLYSSAGTAPRYGIDMESIRTRNDDGSLNETALIENVSVKNSNLTGNESGDIVVYTANNVTIENNYFDKWIANKASHNVIIRNNTFESRNPSFFAIGINSFISPTGEELNYDYIISNNTIRNYGVGIRVAGFNQLVTSNIIENCTTGIFLIEDLYDSVFSGNTITSNLDLSFGYKNFYNCQDIHNLTISDEIIEVRNRPVSFNEFLDESEFTSEHVTFKNCLFNTTNPNFKLLIKAGKNIKFEGNTSNTDFQIINSENIILTNNKTNS